MPIQAQIDDKSYNGGGTVFLLPGDYRSEGVINLPSNVCLIGSGLGSTTIYRLTATSTLGAGNRTFNQRLENIAVAGSGAIGIDWRYVSVAQMRNVYVAGFDTGVLLSDACQYNILDSVYGSANVDGIEINNGANQNTLINCKVSAPISIQIISSNGTTIVGGSGEGASPGNFIKQSGGFAGTNVLGFRGESGGYGPVWCNDQPLAGDF